MNVMDFLRGLGSSVASNNPVTTAVDTAANVIDLGRAAYGYVGHKAGMLSVDQLPEPLDKSGIPGSSAWLDKRFGVNDNTEATTGQLAGMFVNPGKAAPGFIQKAERIFGESGANKRIAQAKAMMAQGYSKEDAWRKTGVTEFGPDHWVTEVSSQGAKFKQDITKLKVGQAYKLTDILDHPGLAAVQGAKAQKDIANTKIRVFPMDHPQMDGSRGGHMMGRSGNEIWLAYDDKDPRGIERALSTLLHENQHNLSSIVGGWKGGNASNYTQDIGEAAYKQAARTIQGGEFARLVQKHKSMKKAEEEFVKKFPDTELSLTQDDWIQLRYLARDLADNWKPEWLDNMVTHAQAQAQKIDDYKQFARNRGMTFEAKNAPPEYIKYVKQADEAAARAVQARARMSQQEIYDTPFWNPGFMDVTDGTYQRAIGVYLPDLEFEKRMPGNGLVF